MIKLARLMKSTKIVIVQNTIPIFWFSQSKNLKKHMKKQKRQQQQNKLKQEGYDNQYQLQQKLSKQKFRSSMLFFAYLPLGVPMLLNIFEPFSLQFISGVNLLQYFGTFHVCLESYKYIEQQKHKQWKLFIPFCLSAVAVNFLEGYASILSPISLMLLTVLANYLKKQNIPQDRMEDAMKARIKNQLAIKIGIYVALSFIAMAKAYHFNQKYQIEQTLKKYKQINSFASKLVQ